MRILNFGSLNIDYVYSVPHFVRPGETLASNNYQIFAGGKGLNQSIALAKAGAKVYHGGKIGREGLFLKEKLEYYNVDTSNIKIVEGASGHAIIQVDPTGQNCIILYGGANKEITHQDINDILSNFGNGDILLLQNEISNIKYILEKAKNMGLRVALNPSPISGDLLECDFSAINWFILNEIEGKELTRQSEPEKIAKELLSRYPHATIVLTLGPDGVLYLDSEVMLRHGVYDVPVVDTTAAGDTFTGYFLAGVLEGLTKEECLKRASIAASLAVGKKGAADSIPYKNEVDQKELEWASYSPTAFALSGPR
ncbi:MAG TPA: ribokinase [Clostridiaceae bacterium]|nr:ribokinase [Clostridiaceae bacterium]